MGFRNNQTFHLFLSRHLPKEFETAPRTAPPPPCTARLQPWWAPAGEGLLALPLAVWEMRSLYLANICTLIGELALTFLCGPAEAHPSQWLLKSKSASPQRSQAREVEVVVPSGHLGPGPWAVDGGLDSDSHPLLPLVREGLGPPCWSLKCCFSLSIPRELWSWLNK